MYVLDIYFYTNAYINRVILDRLFNQVWVNGILKGIGEAHEKNKAFLQI